MATRRDHPSDKVPLQAAARSATTDEQDSEQHEQRQQHLILIGGGHAHVQVIKALHHAARPERLRVTVIDPQEAATYSGMVPGCLAGVYDPRETGIDIRRLADWAGTDFVRDRVVDVDPERRLVYVRDREVPLSYDAVSVDIGSTSRDLDAVPGARQHTVPTRPIDALVRRLKRQQADESRRRNDDDDDDDGEPMRLVVVGGGVAGVELCLSVQEQFHAATGSRPHTTLVHAGSTLLPDVTETARNTLYGILEDRGITVRHDTVVDRVEERRVVVSSDQHDEDDDAMRRLDFDVCLWATGAAAHPLAWHLRRVHGLRCSRHGWIEVDDTLQSTSHDGVFAAGDCAHVIRSDGGSSPPKAGVYAVRAGPVLVENLTRYLDGLGRNDRDHDEPRLQTYVPQDDFMKLLVCGRGKALGLRFGLAFYGKWVLDMKHAIDTSFVKLFEDLPVDTSHIRRGDYDTSQYDNDAEEDGENVHLPAPDQAASLLARTDDDVDYRQAWLVLRTMTQDPDYRKQVLDVMQSQQSSKKKQKQMAS